MLLVSIIVQVTAAPERWRAVGFIRRQASRVALVLHGVRAAKVDALGVNAAATTGVWARDPDVESASAPSFGRRRDLWSVNPLRVG